MTACFRSDVARHVCILTRDFGTRSLQYEFMDIANVTFRYGLACMSRQFAYVPNGVEVIERFQMIFEGLARDCDALLDHQSHFYRT